MVTGFVTTFFVMEHKKYEEHVGIHGERSFSLKNILTKKPAETYNGLKALYKEVI